MLIENHPNMSDEEYSRQIRAMPDSVLLGQELVQQGALHVIRFLLNTEVSVEHATRVRDSLAHVGAIVSAECKRRGLAVIEPEAVPKGVTR